MRQGAQPASKTGRWHFVIGVRVTRLPSLMALMGPNRIFGRVNLRGGEFAWKANRRASVGVRVVRPPLEVGFCLSILEGKRVRVTRLAR
jgi:hypothetical protein